MSEELFSSSVNFSVEEAFNDRFDAFGTEIVTVGVTEEFVPPSLN